MEKHSVVGPRSGNAFLDSLRDDTRAQVRSCLVPVSLRKGEVLSEPYRPRENIYFPVTCMVTGVTRLSDGAAVEVCIAGYEGMSAPSIALGIGSSLNTVIVQTTGSAYCITAEKFTELMHADTHLRERLLAYAAYAFGATMQFAACNRRHMIPERFACSVLMTSDRIGNTVTQTHEAQAATLGVRRAGISLAAEALAADGVIAYRRGRLIVLDRVRLESAACECYGTINDLLVRCMGYSARRAPFMALSA